MARIVKSSNVSQHNTNPYQEKTGVLEMSTGVEMSTGATGPITRTLSKRRSHRRQWRIFECVAMVILDAWLVSIAFQLAYGILKTISDPQNPDNQDNFLIHFFSFIRSNILSNGSGHPGVAKLVELPSLTGLEVGIIVGLIAVFAFRGLYRIRLTGTWFRQAWTIIGSATIGSGFLITYFFLSPTPPTSRLIVPFVWVSAIFLLCVGRLIVSAAMGLLYRLGLGETRLLVVGSGRLGKTIMQHIAANPNLG